jgi:hypothetical protein
MAERVVLNEVGQEDDVALNSKLEPIQEPTAETSSNEETLQQKADLEKRLSMSSDNVELDESKSNGKEVGNDSTSEPSSPSVKSNVVCTVQRVVSDEVEGHDGGCVSRLPVNSSTGLPNAYALKDTHGRSLSLPPNLSSNDLPKRKGSFLNPWKGKKREQNGSSLAKHQRQTSRTLAKHFLERPSDLPPKTRKEERKHKKEVEKLMKKVEKQEKKELEDEKKKWERDEAVADHQLSWKEDILPNWSKKHTSKEVRRLWEKGLPPSIRGEIWVKAIGNRLDLSQDAFDRYVEQCHKKLEDSYSEENASVQAIQLDILRTFPTLGFFQKGCAMHQQLHDVLGAYACFKPDIGYVQGMSFLAAVLLNMDSYQAFVCLSNLLAQPCYSVFFRIDRNLMQPYFDVFNSFFKEEVKSVYSHFERLDVLPHYYLMEWVITLYTKCLPLDVACKLWDLYCRDGESFLFRVALGLLRMYKSKLLELEVLEDCGRFLSKFPEDISSDKLLKHTLSIELSDKRFKQRLHAQQELHESVSSS